ncbi:MAG TPA: bifunctional DNA-binding transcriptional regulator/O6-methylguanine-DNA methyltransferase Ada [Gemmatimonadaceae bacterium]|jgi:AraC family transcriptional regulator of adaptative response/methylated-DNA-[protein]-cysteine methyltransferase
MIAMTHDLRRENLHTETADDARWAAVEQRDGSKDGEFVYGVTSTGVYCRPSCPSRRPSRTNARFFDAPNDAEAAGFRSCLRCKPREDASHSATAVGVAVARKYLDAHTERVVPLDELARESGMSASHLQRSFKRIIGVSPKQYQAAQRVTRFKDRLRAGDTVSRATYEAGFGSSSRVYEKSNDTLGMTPASFRRGGAGASIAYTIADAPLGRLLVATTERGVCAVEIGTTDAEVERQLRADFPNATIARDDDAHATWVRAVIDRVRAPRDRSEHRIPLDLAGTDFQMKVWAALQEIPAGERRSYSEVAKAIGQPSATRAVARACATNKVAIVVPCHRVVRADGSLSGYKWGERQKHRLLNDEAGDR